MNGCDLSKIINDISLELLTEAMKYLREKVSDPIEGSE